MSVTPHGICVATPLVWSLLGGGAVAGAKDLADRHPNFNDDWRFRLGDPACADRLEFGDSNCVGAPHGGRLRCSATGAGLSPGLTTVTANDNVPTLKRKGDL